MNPTSFYFIPLLPSFVKHSSNHRVQQTSFERSLGTREGLVEDFRAVYAIVQFSWIILFGKFQRNLFQRGVSLPCVPLDSTVSALILLRGLILCPEKGTRNTARTNILSLFASMRYRVFLKGEELDILNLNRVIRIMAKIVRWKWKEMYVWPWKNMKVFLRGPIVEADWKGRRGVPDIGGRKIERERESTGWNG